MPELLQSSTINPIDLLLALQNQKISFTLFRNALKNENIPTSQGWEKTIKKITEDISSNPEYKKKIQRIYSNLILYGSKIIKIYKHDNTKKINEILKTYEVIKTSPFYKKFPLPLDNSLLKSETLPPTLVYNNNNEHITTLIFCSKYTINTREKIDDNYLSDDLERDHGIYTEVIGIKESNIQLFDIIIIDNELEHIEFRMDGAQFLTLDSVNNRLIKFKKILEKLISQKTDSTFQLSNTTNFFPLINKLYKEEDGRVKSLSHSTETAGIHNGRARGNKTDVRKDIFQSTGVSAIDEINGFAINKNWDSTTGNGQIALTIPGTLTINSSPNPVIDIAYILNCACHDDYSLLFKKLTT